MEEMTRRLESGLFRPYILWICSKSATSGTDLLTVERTHDHVLSPGKLYPVLHQLAEDGLLQEESRIEHGKVHKYYKTTSEGMKSLARLRSDLGPPMKNFLIDWLMPAVRSN